MPEGAAPASGTVAAGAGTGGIDDGAAATPCEVARTPAAEAT